MEIERFCFKHYVDMMRTTRKGHSIYGNRKLITSERDNVVQVEDGPIVGHRSRDSS